MSTPLPKPRELTDLYEPAKDLFQTLRVAFSVPSTYVLRLDDVDAVQDELTDTAALAALTMRKVQALRLTAQAGYPTASDVVIGLAAELHRSLEELAIVLLAYRDEGRDAHAAVLVSMRNKIDAAARAVGMMSDNSDSVVKLV